MWQRSLIAAKWWRHRIAHHHTTCQYAAYVTKASPPKDDYTVIAEDPPKAGNATYPPTTAKVPVTPRSGEKKEGETKRSGFLKRHATEETPQPFQTFSTQHKYLLNLYARPTDLLMQRGEGCYLFDQHHRQYLDFTAGIAVVALGHAHAGVAQVVSAQAKELVHTSNLYHTPPAASLAEKLVLAAQHSGFDAQSVYLSNSGTEANEAALKFARAYGKAQASSGTKHKIISFKGAFHGRTFGSLSATPNQKYQTPFTPLVPGFHTAIYNDVASVKELMDDDVCAIIVEPIQGEGGIHPADPVFLKQLRYLCDKHKALLIFDEIQCGLGRTGSLFAHTPYDVFPDILTLAKPLANGVPIGATLITEHVAAALYQGSHGTTFGGNPLACAVANYVLDQINQPTFLSHVRDVGEHLQRRCQELQSQFPSLIKEVRGRGLMLGVELQDPNGLVTVAQGDAAPVKKKQIDRIVEVAREHALLIVTAGGTTVRLVPPLIVSRDVVDDAIAIFRTCLEQLQKEI